MNMIQKLRILLSRREKKVLFILLLVSIFVSFLETFSISLVMVFATVATNFTLVKNNKYYVYFYKFLNCSSPEGFVILLGFLLMGFYIFSGSLIALFTYTMSRFSQGRFKHFAFKFFQNYLNFRYKDFTANNSSTISKVVFTDASNITQILDSFLIICAEGLTVTFIYVSLLIVNWKMTFVLTVLLCLKIFFIIKTFSRKLTEIGKKNEKLSILLSRTFTESFWNFKLIKLFANEKPILKKFDKICSGSVKARTLNTMLQNVPRIFLETIGFSILISIIIYVVYFYNSANGVIPIVSMYAFAFYRFLPSVNKMISSYNRIAFCRHSFDSIQKYLAYDLEELGNEKIKFEKNIELKNISFEYDVKNKILDKVNITIKKGERTAFIGESGAGKSTIIDILMGLYRPARGQLFIDGHRLNESNLRSWRCEIGYIPQQIYLFDGTVSQNVVFSREYDEKKVIEVLKRANIYDFLLTQDGINTKVGEGGIRVSGGQKQRIAIARALYSDPEILILDEATSALDNETEEQIMNEIYSLNRDKTLIIVAHRLSTVQRCENIYRIENGKVELVNDLYSLYKTDRSIFVPKQV